MAVPAKEILDGIVNFVRENSHLADPPYKLICVTDVMPATSEESPTAAYGVEVTTAPLSNLEDKTATIMWLEPPLLFFVDTDIHWPIDDPNINPGKIAMMVLEDVAKLHAVAAEAVRGRSLNELSGHVKDKADLLKSKLVSLCEIAAGELHTKLKDDPNVQTVGHTCGGLTEQIIIYTFKKAKDGTHPTDFKGFPVLVRRMGTLTPAGDAGGEG